MRRPTLFALMNVAGMIYCSDGKPYSRPRSPQLFAVRETAEEYVELLVELGHPRRILVDWEATPEELREELKALENFIDRAIEVETSTLARRSALKGRIGYMERGK